MIPLARIHSDQGITSKLKIPWIKNHIANLLLKGINKASLSKIPSETHHHQSHKKAKVKAPIKSNPLNNIVNNKVLCKCNNKNLSVIVKNPIA
jgi:hypothetical protein